MKKFVRRVLIAVGLLIVLVLMLSGVTVWMFRAAPDWYRPIAIAPGDRDRLAQAAENKLIDAQNWAAELRADEARTARAAQSGATRPVTRAAGGKVIELSQDELNALFAKWSQLNRWEQKYSEFVESPVVILRDGLLIIAGRLKELGAVASFQFRPSVDAKGHLMLELVNVTGGRLPLPQSFWAPYRDNLSDSLRQQLPQWRRTASITSTGAANTSAMAATMGRLFLDAANGQPADAILFLPLVERGESVPVRVTDVAIEEAKIIIAVQPLTPPERAALLTRIHSPIDSPQPSGR